MTTKAEDVTRFTKKRFVWCLVGWLLICVTFYVFIYIREYSHTQRLIKTGVAISKNISSQSGLPLLERNIDLLSKFLEEITEKPGVVFASIIDHKNKLIAYTDRDQFLTLKKEKSGDLDGVNYWRISGMNHQKVMNFSSEITFSDTRVGEVFISLAAQNMDTIKFFFLYSAVLSLWIILFMFGFARYRIFLLWLGKKCAQLGARGTSE
jgi:hypothetical protein